MASTSAAEVTGRPQRKSAVKARIIFANLLQMMRMQLDSNAESRALHTLEEADLNEELEGGECQTDVSDDEERNEDAEIHLNQ